VDDAAIVGDADRRQQLLQQPSKRVVTAKIALELT